MPIPFFLCFFLSVAFADNQFPISQDELIGDWNSLPDPPFDHLFSFSKKGYYSVVHKGYNSIYGPGFVEEEFGNYSIDNDGWRVSLVSENGKVSNYSAYFYQSNNDVVLYLQNIKYPAMQYRLSKSVK